MLFFRAQSWPLDLVDHRAADELAQTTSAGSVSARARKLQTRQAGLFGLLGGLQKRQVRRRLKAPATGFYACFKNASGTSSGIRFFCVVASHAGNMTGFRLRGRHACSGHKRGLTNCATISLFPGARRPDCP